jgi:TonB family protein
MAHTEQSSVPAGSTTLEHATPEHDVVPAQSTGRMPVVAVLVALAFAASAFFFYHQGQRDAALSAASAPASTTDDAAKGSTSLVANDSGDRASARTIAQTYSDGKPDIIVVVHPTAAQMRAPAAKRMLAKVSKPAAPIVTTAAIERAVALATRPQPVYPVQALRAREQGTVLVLVQVDVNGHVSDARIVHRSGSNILDRAAPNEVRRWQFEPALHNGQPIVASVEVPVSYRLDQ